MPGEEELEAKIDALYETAKQLKTERDALNQKARKLRENRDEYNAKVKAMMEEANEFKEKRDKLNAKIKVQKKRRNEAAKAAKMTRNKMDEMGIDRKKLPRFRPEVEIKEEMKRLEWQIQTSVLSIAKERKLVDKIEKLRKELQETRKLRQKMRDMGDERIKVEALRMSSSKLHSEVLDLSKESQKHHKKMIEIIEESKPVRKQADEYHHRMLDVIKEADKKHKDLLDVRETLSKLLEQEKGLQRRRKQRTSVATENKLKKRAEEALEKLRAGQKVELDELMLLKEFDMM
jgi:uncharacterized coiled-coil DUF342 family protein